jgi:NAD(P)-dependent dehydrogenase (short-subunit alcohol dehydrogenase family)
VITIPLDVSSKESVAALWKEIAEKGLKVDVLVNNAGIRGAIAKIGEGDVDAWWAVQVRIFYYQSRWNT